MTADLSKKQQQAIIALLDCKTIRDACAASGTAERTMYTWLNDATFSAAYRAARAQAVRQAISRLQRSASDAAETLRSVATDTTAKESARVAAARAILEFAIRSVELEDIQQRLAALEERIANEEQTNA